MGKMSQLGNDLYQGRRSFNFVGRPWLFYGIAAVVVGLMALTLYLKPLNMGVEFVGGTTVAVETGAGNASQSDADDLRDAVLDSGIENTENPSVTTEGSKTLTIQVENLTQEQRVQMDELLAKRYPDLDPKKKISTTDIGPSWGAEVGKKMITGIAIFLVLVVLFIWGYFREWRMSVAALVALGHDIALTIMVYALSGFQVTPAAVTGLLAILGFSLYDTVVVFDKVKENTTVLRKNTQSYSDAANLAVNQTLVRSINTSLIALLPIGAILYVSVVQLGASSLQDLALAQFVGMAVGVYSSVMLAPRMLVHLKMQESEMQVQARRARAKQRALADRYASVPAAVAEDGSIRGQRGTAVAERTDPGGPDELAEPDEVQGPDDKPARPARPRQSDA
ncbi:MAG: protein translocase subunit SecF, partial [Nocardioidaceae bacterium]|nr:protein translocase subunit SecF [Nocardioidaceae bacterium]